MTNGALVTTSILLTILGAAWIVAGQIGHGWGWNAVGLLALVLAAVVNEMRIGRNEDRRARR